MMRFATVAAVLLGAACGLAADAPATRGAAVRAEDVELPVPGKDTTYILGPVDENGVVDYIAYMKAHWSRGITRGNNAFYVYARAFGPDMVGEGVREELIGWMKLPEEGPYVRPVWSLELDWDDEEKLEKQYDRALEGPYRPGELALLERWLRDDREALAVAFVATKMRRYYPPIAVDPAVADVTWPMLSAACPSGIARMRELTRRFVQRANGHFGAGRMDDGWRDVAACLRMSNHCCQGPTVISRLLAAALRRLACQPLIALAKTGELTEAQALALAGKLSQVKLRPVGSAEVLEHSERFVRLEMLYRYGYLRRPKLTAVDVLHLWHQHRTLGSVEALIEGFEGDKAGEKDQARAKRAFLAQGEVGRKLWRAAERMLEVLGDKEATRFSPLSPAWLAWPGILSDPDRRKLRKVDALAGTGNVAWTYAMKAYNRGWDQDDDVDAGSVTWGRLERRAAERRREAGERLRKNLFDVLGAAVVGDGTHDPRKLGTAIGELFRDIAGASTISSGPARASASAESYPAQARAHLLIAAYHGRRGEWPADLAAVAKEYGPVPKDPLTKEPFGYKRTAGGYELIALDPNEDVLAGASDKSDKSSAPKE